MFVLLYTTKEKLFTIQALQESAFFCYGKSGRFLVLYGLLCSTEMLSN